MKWKRWTIGTVAALAGAGLFASWPDSKAAPCALRTARVERGPLLECVTANGTLQPLASVQVGCQVSGTISELLADFNSRVKAGQVIARLDPSALESRVLSDRAGLRRAEADVKRARALLRQAERDFARAQELAKAELISVAEADGAQTRHETAAADLELAESAVDQARSALRNSEINLSYATIASPVDGIVISRNVEVGQTLAASFLAPVLFLIAGDLSRMQIEASVDEADIGRIRPDQAATFAVSAYPDRMFTAQVSRVRLSPTVTQNVVTYKVELTAGNPDGVLLPGMTAEVSFEVERREDALKVPNSALRLQPRPEQVVGDAATGEEGAGVYVPAGNLVKPVPVKTGITDGAWTEVCSCDLKEGDEVVTGFEDKARLSSGFFSPFTPPRRGGLAHR